MTLLLDAIALAAASVLLWQQHLIRGAAVALAGFLLSSALVFAFGAKPRGTTVTRFAVRIAGALVLLGGAWFTSPAICVAGIAIVALSIVSRSTIETLAREFGRRATSSRSGTSLHGLSYRLSQRVSSFLFALALVDVLVLYFAGHDIRAYLTENSDLLYLPTLFVDVLSQGGHLGDWYLTPAPYFFPDYVVYLAAHLLGPSIYVRIGIFAVAQALVTFGAFWFLARSVFPTSADATMGKANHAVVDAALITIVLLWLGVNAGEPFVILFASASHFGAFICSVLLAALWIRRSAGRPCTGRQATLVALAALAFLATLSDGLFAVEALVPFAAAAALGMNADLEGPRRIGGLGALAAVWLLLAAVIPIGVYRVPIAPPNINVNWAPSVTNAQRAELEAKYHLSDGDFRGGQLWTYVAHDTTRDTIAALVQDPRVDDTQHIDRQRFTVDGAEGPLARAISVVPIGFAASTLAVLGLLFLVRRAKAIPIVALVPICGVLGALFYNVIVPRHTRYPLSVGFEKVYSNSADLYTLVYRTATGTPLFGVVLVAYVVCIVALLAPAHLRTLGRTVAPPPPRNVAPSLSWLALFSLCSVCATAAVVSLLTDLPVMPRYVIPIFAWPIVVTALFAGRALGTRYVMVGTAAILIATGALTNQAYQLAKRSPVASPFYPPAIACLDSAVAREDLHNGIAQYWDAKYLQDFSRRDLRIGQYLENLEEMPWITSARYFRERYDFAVVDENAEPTYKISIGALTTINGAPQQMVTCGSRTVYVWGKDRMRVTAAGSPAPAAAKPR